MEETVVYSDKKPIYYNIILNTNTHTYYNSTYIYIRTYIILIFYIVFITVLYTNIMRCKDKKKNVLLKSIK